MSATIYTGARNGTLTSTRLQKYVIDGVNINSQEPGRGLTPLGASAQNGHLSVVELLLASDADVNAKSTQGRTPLFFAANAKKNRVAIIKALLSRNLKIDEPSDDGDTALMEAIVRARDPEIVKLLIEAGASTKAKNKRGETAEFLASQSSAAEIRRALLPPDQQTPGREELVLAIVNFTLFILTYVNSGILGGVAKGVITQLFNMLNPDQLPDSQLSDAISNPSTVDDFKKSIEDFILNTNPALGQFFAPGNDYLNKVAEKAVELKEDPDNKLGPDKIKDLCILALYQPVLYCDDSGSMKTADGGAPENRMALQRRLAARMTSVANRLVPEGEGVHLRFINKVEAGLNQLSKDQIQQKLDTTPSGATAIGTNLKEKVLKPFIYDIFSRGQNLSRPYLIMTITDGCPDPEPHNTFKNNVAECERQLTQKGYDPASVRFLVSRVGADSKAIDFIKSFDGDATMDRMVHRTSDQLDKKFEELRKNERELEEWLLNVMISPIVERN